MVRKNTVTVKSLWDEAILEEIVERLYGAEKRIGVMMYIMSNNWRVRRIHDIIVEKYRRGIEVYIVLNAGSREPLKYNCETARYLVVKGLPEDNIVLTPRTYHTKIIVVDDYVLSGSYNLTTSVHAGKTEHAFLVGSKQIADSVYAVIKYTFMAFKMKNNKSIQEICGSHLS